MKSFARRVLRPFTGLLKRLARPVTSRVRARVFLWSRQATDARFENLEGQVAVASADIEGLERYMPAVLNAIASQNAMNRANVRSEEEIARLVRSVLERFESVVAELTPTGQGIGVETFVEPKVLHPDRLKATDDGLKLNLGCGHEPLAGYVNVDGQALDGVDVLADPRNLPFEPMSIAEIRAVHVLSRFSTREIQEVMLPHWASLLAPGGTIVAVVPDADSMIKSYVSGQLGFDVLRDRTFGATAEPVRTMFSTESLSALFADAGLNDVNVRRCGWPEVTHEIEVVATKSAPRHRA